MKLEVFTYKGTIVVQAGYDRFYNRQYMRDENSHTFIDIYDNRVTVTEKEYREFKEFLLQRYRSEREYTLAVVARYEKTQKQPSKAVRLINRLTRMLP